MSLSRLTKEIQRAVGSKPDGVYGPNTARAILAKLELDEPKKEISSFPSQAQVRGGGTIFGKRGGNLTMIELPYPMRLSWDTNVTVKRMTVNSACARSLKAILEDTLDHYGIDKIRMLGLALLGGCYNNRRVRGGSMWAIHSWGAALDLDPERNTLHMDHREAEFAKPAYEPFFDIVYKHRWVSLGKEKDYDWMHIQAPRL